MIFGLSMEVVNEGYCINCGKQGTLKIIGIRGDGCNYWICRDCRSEFWMDLVKVTKTQRENQ